LKAPRQNTSLVHGHCYALVDACARGRYRLCATLWVRTTQLCPAVILSLRCHFPQQHCTAVQSSQWTPTVAGHRSRAGFALLRLMTSAAGKWAPVSQGPLFRVWSQQSFFNFSDVKEIQSLQVDGNSVDEVLVHPVW